MKYDRIKERRSEDSFAVIYIAKERKCDICSNLRKRQDIEIVKYPIIDKYMGRVIMTKKVCNDCIDDVREILDNLKYN